MSKTLRPQNKCGACGHTWYPRGKNLSPKCPECGSRETKILAPSILGTAVVGFLLWASGDEKAPATTAPPEAPAVAVSEQAAEPAALPIPWCVEPVLPRPVDSVPGDLLSATMVRLQWTHDGRVHDAVVVSSSGNEEVDSVALKAVSEARICGTQAGEGTYAIQHTHGGQLDHAAARDDYVAPNRGAAAIPTPTSEFPLVATLQDPDGIVVLQSKPSMFGKNVSEMAVGSTVLASAREGKWIAVRTTLGEIGYVRQRQLRFDEP